MSGYYYPTSSAEEEYNLSQTYQAPTMPIQQPLPVYEPQLFPGSESYPPPQQPFIDQVGYFPPSAQYTPHLQQQYQQPEPSPWIQSQVLSNAYIHPSYPTSFPRYTETFEYGDVGSSRVPANYLSPQIPSRGRLSRATSFASNASSAQSVSVVSQSDVSRSVSPNAGEMAKWGFKNTDGSWSCGYPGCASRSTFTRGCDLRKHYKRHSKSLFCRHDGCPQATEGGFSSKKDRARHEAKHNPEIVCEWEGCERLFSRQDNMVSCKMHRSTSSPQQGLTSSRKTTSEEYTKSESHSRTSIVTNTIQGATPLNRN